MAVDLYSAVANGNSRTVQAKGNVTLPKEWRDKHGIKPGDVVVLYEDDEELRVLPPNGEEP